MKAALVEGLRVGRGNKSKPAWGRRMWEVANLWEYGMEGSQNGGDIRGMARSHFVEVSNGR